MTTTVVTVTTAAVLAQLEAAGVSSFLKTLTLHEATLERPRAYVSGTIKRSAITYLTRLRVDGRRAFRGPVPAALHPEVGRVRIEFRSLGGVFGPGSLQIVVGVFSGRYEADIDRFNPLESVQDLIDHNVREVWVKPDAGGVEYAAAAA